MEIPTLDERLAALAAHCRMVMQDDVDTMHYGALGQAASVLELLASAGATGPLMVPSPPAFDDAELRAAIRADAEKVACEQLAEALGGGGPVGGWQGMLAEVRSLASSTTVSDRQADLVAALGPYAPQGGDWIGLVVRVREFVEQATSTREMTRQLCEALGLGWTNEHAWDGLLTHVRAQVGRVDAIREEFRRWVECSRPTVLAAELSDVLGLDEPGAHAQVIGKVRELVEWVGTLEQDLENERRVGRELEDAEQAFVEELRRLLGLDADVRGAIARQQVIGNVRALVQRSAASTRHHEAQARLIVNEGKGWRSTLVDMLKALQTYAPGHEEMSTEELRAEVNTVLARTLKELHAERKVTAGLTAHVVALNTRLGIGAHAPADDGRYAVAALQGRAERAELRIDRAKVMHLADQEGHCATCRVDWPCQTRQVLIWRAGDEEPEDDQDSDQDGESPW